MGVASLLAVVVTVSESSHRSDRDGNNSSTSNGDSSTSNSGNRVIIDTIF